MEAQEHCVRLCVCVCASKEKIWRQIDGMAIGKTIFGDVTGIFMESYGEEFILNPQNNEFIPAFWKWEDEDVKCLWQDGIENIQ